MGLVLLFGLIKINMKDNFSKIKFREKVNSLGIMEKYMKEIL